MTVGEVEAAAAAVAAVVALYGLSKPLRTWWAGRRARAERYRQEHDGRPAITDPTTGAVIEPARPGMAATVEGIHTRQQEILSRVDAIHAAVTQSTATADAFQAAVEEIRTGMRAITDRLEKQELEADRRHSENRAFNAETRSEVARLELAQQATAQVASEAAREAKDAAGHAQRIDRQQQEMAQSIDGRFDSFDERFAEHQVVEQAFVRSLAELGVQVDPSRKET